MMHSRYFSLIFVFLRAFGIKIMQSNLSGKGPQSDSTAFCRKRNVPAEIFQLLLKKTLFLLRHPFVQRSAENSSVFLRLRLGHKVEQVYCVEHRSRSQHDRSRQNGLKLSK